MGSMGKGCFGAAKKVGSEKGRTLLGEAGLTTCSRWCVLSALSSCPRGTTYAYSHPMFPWSGTFFLLISDLDATPHLGLCSDVTFLKEGFLDHTLGQGTDRHHSHPLSLFNFFVTRMAICN